jgi:hypothetical protein
MEFLRLIFNRDSVDFDECVDDGEFDDTWNINPSNTFLYLYYQVY